MGLRVTVIAKTDIYNFSEWVKKFSEAELSAFLEHHKNFVADVCVRNEGSIIKGEGDSFWIIFPSVTMAAIAALELQQELRLMQLGKSDDERVAIRVAITLGDVLHQDADIFGGAVNLAARIESITPHDEIYLSQAAWLALNRAEIQTSFVNDFTLKGVAKPEKVYKVDQTHKTRTVTGQVIVFTDLAGFTNFQEVRSISEVENMLVHIGQVTKDACQGRGGIIRLVLGDGHFLTFSETHQALSAVTAMCQQWRRLMETHDFCDLRIGIHQGSFNIFRSHIYGGAVNLAHRFCSLGTQIVPETIQTPVLVSNLIKSDVSGTFWEHRLHPASVPDSAPESDTFQAVAEKYGIFLLDIDSLT